MLLCYSVALRRVGSAATGPVPAAKAIIRYMFLIGLSLKKVACWIAWVDSLDSL